MRTNKSCKPVKSIFIIFFFSVISLFSMSHRSSGRKRRYEYSPEDDRRSRKRSRYNDDRDRDHRYYDRDERDERDRRDRDRRDDRDRYERRDRDRDERDRRDRDDRDRRDRDRRDKRSSERRDEKEDERNVTTRRSSRDREDKKIQEKEEISNDVQENNVIEKSSDDKPATTNESSTRKKQILTWHETFKKKLKEKEEAEKLKQAEAKKEEEEKKTREKILEDKITEMKENDSMMDIDSNEDDNSNIKKDNEDEDEEDPLDAFMKEIYKTPVESVKSSFSTLKGRKDDIKEDRFFDEEEKEDEEDESWKQKVRKRELEQVDHSKVIYRPFRKNFYIEVPDIKNMTKEEVKEYRESLGNIKIRGKKCPRPIKGFHQCGLNDRILELLKKYGYAKPTPIQAQAIPAIMSGQDVIGIAKTGSGKTLAFLLPMLRHILDQDLPSSGEGPIGIIMAPARELAVQIHTELKRFTKHLGIKSVCIFGGSGISHQIGDLKRGAAIAVCTPGRMIDILCTNAGRVTNLRRVTYLVLDEADRMFDLGFEPQIMRIIDNIRPDRQTVMFSATFPRQVEAAARKILRRPIVEIVVGGVSVVCSDVTQIVEVIKHENKFVRLLQLLGEWNPKGSILIFVNQQDECDFIFRKLLNANYQCGTLHGGKDQMDRASTIADFKNGDVTIMVATSVAARGLDVPSLNLVINYSCPNHYEDYVHRCGRTGRAGRKGTAVTFITEDEDQFAPDLERALTESGVEIPIELKQLTESFGNKLTAGQAGKHGSGFGGSGYKFDEAEAQAKKKQESLQRKAYLGDEDDGDEEEDEASDFEDIPSTTTKEPEVQQQPIVQQPTEHGATQPKTDNIDAVIRNLVNPTANAVSTDGHTAEIEINDYPQQARWKVTHKVSLIFIIYIILMGLINFFLKILGCFGRNYRIYRMCYYSKRKLYSNRKSTCTWRKKIISLY